MSSKAKARPWTYRCRALKTFLRPRGFLHHDLTFDGIKRKATRDFIAILIVVAANFTLQCLNVYQRYELVDFDHLARAAHLISGTSLEISIVQIDDELYSSHFGNSSPLDAKLVGKIVRNLLLGNPSVLAVDLDTSGWPPGTRESFRSYPTPVVWSLEPTPDGRIEIEPGTRFGVPVFQPGPDGRLRRYQRGIAIPSPPCPLTLSFPAAVIAATDLARMQCPKDTEERFIGFGMRHFRKLPASVFVDEDEAKVAYWPAITGKIVFLGGTFRAARDTYVTPLGPESGVEILAQAAQTERDGSVYELSRFWGFCCDLAISLIVLLFAIYFAPVPQLILSGLLSLEIVWCVGAFGYHTQILFLPLCTAFGGVMVAGLVEILWCHGELWIKHRTLSGQTRQLTHLVGKLKNAAPTPSAIEP